MDVLGQYLTTLWSLLCQRLQTSATPKYTRYFLIFLALFIDKHGVSTVTTSLDSVQSGLFGMLLQQVLMPNFASVTGDVEHKLCAVALTKILCDCPAILSDKNTWTKLLALLVTYIEGNAGEGAGGDDGDDEERALAGYSAAFAQLHHAQRKETDPLPDVRDVRHFLATSLSAMSHTHPVGAVIAQGLDSQSQNALKSYLTAAGNLPLN